MKNKIFSLLLLGLLLSGLVSASYSPMSHADEASSSKVQWVKLLDRKSFGSEFQNFQYNLFQIKSQQLCSGDFMWNFCLNYEVNEEVLDYEEDI